MNQNLQKHDKIVQKYAKFCKILHANPKICTAGGEIAVMHHPIFASLCTLHTTQHLPLTLPQERGEHIHRTHTGGRHLCSLQTQLYSVYSVSLKQISEVTFPPSKPNLEAQSLTQPVTSGPLFIVGMVLLVAVLVIALLAFVFHRHQRK